MNLQRLIFWAAVFACLLSYVLMFERRESVEVAVPEPVRNTVFTLSADDVTAVRIAREDETVIVRRTAGGGWKVAQPRGCSVKDSLVESVLDTLVTTVVIEVIAEYPDDLTQYGLAAPFCRIALVKKNEQAGETLLLGKTAPSGVSLYAQREGENSVLLLGTYIRFALNTFLDNVTRPGS
jgi:hypothetical protein